MIDLDNEQYDLVGEILEPAFAAFRADPAEQLRVRVRRFRAGQLRSMWAQPETITLEVFNPEVFSYESSAFIGEDEVTGQLEGPLSSDDIAEWNAALESDDLRLQGNYHWNRGGKPFGTTLNESAEEKQQLVQSALKVVANPTLSPEDKVAQIEAISGFGATVATGLVMLAHPTAYCIWNKQGREAFEKFGLIAESLEDFQEHVRDIRARLMADDFIELYRFLYLINKGQIQVGTALSEIGEPSALEEANQPQGTKPPQRYWAISLGEGGRLWPQCRQEGTIVIG